MNKITIFVPGRPALCFHHQCLVSFSGLPNFSFSCWYTTRPVADDAPGLTLLFSLPVNFHYLCHRLKVKRKTPFGFSTLSQFYPPGRDDPEGFLISPTTPSRSQNDKSLISAEKSPQIQNETPLRPPLTTRVMCKYPGYGSNVEIQGKEHTPPPPPPQIKQQLDLEHTKQAGKKRKI